MKKSITLDEAFVQLEEILKIMDEQNLSLEDSFQYYKQGIELINYCNQSIAHVEQKIKILTGDNEEHEF